jgi:hypothetical protein
MQNLVDIFKFGHQSCKWQVKGHSSQALSVVQVLLNGNIKT